MGDGNGGGDDFGGDRYLGEGVLQLQAWTSAMKT